MTAERQFFIQILSDFINKMHTEIPDGINWKDVQKYARSHQVEGIVYYQCRDGENARNAALFEGAYCTSLICYTNRKLFVDKLSKRLCDENIPHFCVKGLDIASYYPVPQLRTMGDVDIVVDRKNRVRVHEMLLELGCVCESKIDDREWIYNISGMEYELHDRLIYDETVSLQSHREFFNDPWKYTDNTVIDNSFHLLFLLAHLRKHIMNKGAGFRQFLDIASMIKYGDNISWSFVAEQLDILEMRAFSEKVFALCERWFDVSCPLNSGACDERFFENAENFIFANGIFGFDNEDNSAAHAANSVRNTKKPFSVMVKNAVRTLFPSYKSMVAVEKYSFIKGKAYLLPAAWLYRFVSVLFRGNGKRGVKKLVNAFASAEDIKKRHDILTEWGL